MCAILVVGITSTSFAFLPQYRQVSYPPSATVGRLDDGTQVVIDVRWSLCNSTETVDACKASAALLEDFQDISHFLDCGSDVEPFSLPNIYVEADYCVAEQCTDERYTSVRECRVVDYPGLSTCLETEGSQVVTIWTYFAVRTVFQWGIGSAFTLLDSTALKMAERHDSDYSYIYLYGMIAHSIAPFIAGYLIRDDEEGSGGACALSSRSWP